MAYYSSSSGLSDKAIRAIWRVPHTENGSQIISKETIMRYMLSSLFCIFDGRDLLSYAEAKKTKPILFIPMTVFGLSSCLYFRLVFESLMPPSDSE